MKKIFLAVFASLICNFALANALESIEAQNLNLQKKYEQTLAQIAQERKEINQKLESARNQTKSLEADLKFAKENSADFDLALKNLTHKTRQYDALRRNIASLASDLNTQKVLPANNFEALTEQLFLLLTEADSQIFSAKILDKAIVGMSGADFLKNLESGKNFKVKFDTSLGKLSLVKTRTFWQKIEAGGVWIYPILAFGLLALLVSIFKSISSLKMGRFKPETLEKINSLLEKEDVDGAMNVAKNAPKPYSGMLKKFLENRGISKSLVEEIAYEQMLSCGEKLFSGLGILAVTAAISPLLGLLGTVTGIIKTFGDLSIYGAGNPQLMSGGISEALITTEFGLIVAIPAFVIHAILSRRAKAILSDMEKISSEYISKNFK